MLGALALLLTAEYLEPTMATTTQTAGESPHVSVKHRKGRCSVHDVYVE
jgi:hypothetical protein